MDQSPNASASRLAPAVQLALAVAYPFLAHAASVRGSGVLAACALGTIALMVLADGLLRGRAGAWLALVAVAAVLAWLAGSRHALTPLLLVPVAFVGMIAWWFGRTLRAGRTPLIARIVSAIDGVPPAQLEPGLRAYARNLTLAWALLLALLGLCNLVLAAIAVPRGLLTEIGITPPLSVTEEQWSWCANWLNYGLVGGFFLLEFAWRKRRFPGRYRSFFDFLMRLSRLGPAFWRGLLR
jgi:uncharacterized membrane protein